MHYKHVDDETLHTYIGAAYVSPGFKVSLSKPRTTRPATRLKEKCMQICRPVGQMTYTCTCMYSLMCFKVTVYSLISCAHEHFNLVCIIILLAWSDIMSDQDKLWSDITNSWANIHKVYM